MEYLSQLITVLKNKRKTLAVAESCSGGYLSYIVTKIPGSSKVFKGGIIAYSLESKHTFFGIHAALLNKTQGVSEKVSRLLAEKVRQLFKSGIGASIVGFAGPGAKKGVKTGTVFISVADQNGTETKKAVINGPRDTVRKKASNLAVNLIYKRTVNIK